VRGEEAGWDIVIFQSSGALFSDDSANREA